MSSLLSNSFTCLSMSARGEGIRQAERGAHHLGKRRIGEHLVEGGQGRRLALEIERQPHALVLLAGILLERLAQILVDRRAAGAAVKVVAFSPCSAKLKAGTKAA